MTDRKRLCVYTHSVNGQVFYVGQGSLKRAYDRHSRRPRWKGHVEKVGAFDTDILVLTDDRAEVQRIEAGLIAAHKPSCNVQKFDRRAINLKPPGILATMGGARFTATEKAALEKAARDDARPVAERKYLK